MVEKSRKESEGFQARFHPAAAPERTARGYGGSSRRIRGLMELG